MDLVEGHSQSPSPTADQQQKPTNANRRKHRY
jgi:hypothetical protein